MAQQIKALAAKPDELSLILEDGKEENQFPQIFQLTFIHNAI